MYIVWQMFQSPYRHSHTGIIGEVEFKTSIKIDLVTTNNYKHIFHKVILEILIWIYTKTDHMLSTTIATILVGNLILHYNLYNS